MTGTFPLQAYYCTCLPFAMHEVVMVTCKPGACTWACMLACKLSAACMCRVNLVLVGAEGVVENGGIINKLGSYQVAIAAKEHCIPFYVAAESYKVCTTAC